MTLATKTDGLLQLSQTRTVDETARRCEVWSAHHCGASTRCTLTSYACRAEQLLSGGQIRVVIGRQRHNRADHRHNAELADHLKQRGKHEHGAEGRY